MTFYRLAADAVVVAHFSYVAFVVVGLLVVLVGRLRRWEWTRGFWFRIAHLTAIAVVVAEAWCGVTCPLTTLENWLRVRGGGATYEGDFIGNLAHELLFWEGEPWQFTAAYTVFGLLVAATLLIWPPRRPSWMRREK